MQQHIKNPFSQALQDRFSADSATRRTAMDYFGAVGVACLDRPDDILADNQWMRCWQALQGGLRDIAPEVSLAAARSIYVTGNNGKEPASDLTFLRYINAYAKGIDMPPIQRIEISHAEWADNAPTHPEAARMIKLVLNWRMTDRFSCSIAGTHPKIYLSQHYADLPQLSMKAYGLRRNRLQEPIGFARVLEWPRLVEKIPPDKDLSRNNIHMLVPDVPGMVVVVEIKNPIVGAFLYNKPLTEIGLPGRPGTPPVSLSTFDTPPAPRS
jgi:hypothetical protein